MRPQRIKHIANGEIAKLTEIKECIGHEWAGPAQEVQWGDDVMFLYHCKHCPLAKLFETKE